VSKQETLVDCGLWTIPCPAPLLVFCEKVSSKRTAEPQKIFIYESQSSIPIKIQVTYEQLLLAITGSRCC
jgi:hypothetical protein